MTQLHEALRQQIDDEMRTEGTPRADIDAVVKRGYRLRLFRRAGFGLGVLALLFVSAGVLALTLDREPDDRDRRRSTVALNTPEVVTEAHTASFGLRAVAQAGLLDPFDVSWSYRGVKETANGWDVRFASASCSFTTCEPPPGRDPDGNLEVDSVVSVVLRGADLAVSEVVTGGPLTAQQHDDLTSFEEPPYFGEPRVEATEVRIVEGRDSLLSGAHYWVGPIPDPPMLFSCVVEGRDRDGEVTWRRYLSVAPPESEEGRVGSFLSKVSADEEVVAAEASCQRFTGPGWELDGEPELRLSDDGLVVRARVPLVWRAPPVTVEEHFCEITVFDSNQSTVGQARFVIAGANFITGEPPPYRVTREVIVDVGAGSDIADAAVTCPLPPYLLGDDPEAPEDAAAPEETGEPRAEPVTPEDLRDRWVIAAEGTFEAGEWGEREGDHWRLYVWGTPYQDCRSFKSGAGYDDPPERGAACSYYNGGESPSEAVGTTSYEYPEGYVGQRVALVHGTVRDDVARIEFKVGDEVITGEIIAAPDEIDGRVNYFVQALPPGEPALVLAYDSGGKLLQEKMLTVDKDR